MRRKSSSTPVNAEQRYLWVRDNEPELLENLPEYHIASYLGIDAMSVLRLKRKLELD
ncbi:MAG: hypothetical protein ACJAYC_003477 [Halieaceae bacterium]|jgi:hypothetical protein